MKTNTQYPYNTQCFTLYAQLSTLYLMFQTPILLIIFNRPETTRKVFETIRQQKPKYLYVAADGPRVDKPNDIEKCRVTRDIIKVDWECDLKTLYRSENRGCGYGPSEAISWFFDHVEEGIILEDDSVPHADFFVYSAQLLNTYRNNDRIKVIGSANFQKESNKIGYSYYFSMQNGCFCSWATWKRTWKEFDYYLKTISINEFKKSLKHYRVSLKEYIYWIGIFYQVKKDRYKDSCWDYQLMFSIWKNKGFGVVPNVNLASNIGFNQNASHTFNEHHPGANKIAGSILPLKHPDSLILSREADLFYHNFYYQPPSKGKERLVLYIVLVNKLIKSFFNINQSWKNHFLALFRNIYAHLASRKSDIKNRLFWKKQGRSLRSKILNYYKLIPAGNLSVDEKEVVNYLKKNKIALLPYEFTKKYRKKKVEVIKDSGIGLNYVLFQNKRLYYRKDWNVNKIKTYHVNLLAEQDSASPHCYLTNDFVLNNNEVLVDVGAAEGIFGLMNIEKVKKIFLIEPDALWIEALKATFSPWVEKTVFLEKYASAKDSDKTISIDSYFKKSIIDFIKIDVEGSESELLKGCENVFNRNYPIKVVIATYHHQNDEKDFMNYFVSKGFNGSFSQGFITYFYELEFEQPYLRKGLIRAQKQII